MTEQQQVQVAKLYPIIDKACRIGVDKLSLSFFYNLQNLCQNFVVHNSIEYKNTLVEELYNKILGYIEYTEEPRLETFLTLFKGA